MPNDAALQGEAIRIENGQLQVPHRPIIPFIEGDGTGPDIWRAARRILDAAVEKVYGGEKAIAWTEVLAGEKAYNHSGEWLPAETLQTIRKYRVAIKGPLTTPVGGGIRSLNVALRQELDLYACVRPIRWFQGVPSPVKRPDKVNMVVFRENTEDVYSGIEWKAGTPDADRIRRFLADEMQVELPEDAGIGIKPISREKTRRLVRMALEYAIARGRRYVTLMHKGNIMKFTEGAFRDWGYEVARDEFSDQVITEDDLWQKYDGKAPERMVVLKDRIADITFQHVLLRPEEHEVIATPNLNGDFLSDDLAALVGGVGMAPGANIGDGYAVFEATHGTAPKYANLDKVNPGSLVLSGVMMLEHLGWNEAADAVTRALEKTIGQKYVTYDLARGMDGATEAKTSEFATRVIENL